jgi:hypothetical protein
MAQNRPLAQILAALNDAAAATRWHLRLMGKHSAAAAKRPPSGMVARAESALADFRSAHRSGGFSRGAGQSDGNDEVEVRERAPALVEA